MWFFIFQNIWNPKEICFISVLKVNYFCLNIIMCCEVLKTKHVLEKITIMSSWEVCFSWKELSPFPIFICYLFSFLDWGSGGKYCYFNFTVKEAEVDLLKVSALDWHLGETALGHFIWPSELCKTNVMMWWQWALLSWSSHRVCVAWVSAFWN